MFRYFKMKRQLRNINRQLQDERFRPQSISAELFDRDVEQLVLSINKLMDENNRLLLERDKINQDLKRSVADISHDIRTPLTSILGYLKMLERTELNEKQGAYLKISQEKAMLLRELLTQFFELSAMDADQTIPELDRIDLSGIISEAILGHAEEFEEQQIKPVFQQADIPVFIMGNTRMVQRIMENLISNCLRYSSGDVVFSLQEGDHVILRVKNPVHKEAVIDPAKIFQRFYKADSSRRGKGTGLGLAIVQQLVEGMGGAACAYTEADTIVLQLEFLKS